VRRLSYRRRVACDAKLVLVGRGELFARDVDTGVCAAPSSSFLRTPKWVRLSVAEDVLARHSCEGRRRFSTAEGWSSSDFALRLSRFLWSPLCSSSASVPPTRRAFRSAAAARVTFLLLAQKKS